MPVLRTIGNIVVGSVKSGKFATDEAMTLSDHATQALVDLDVATNLSFLMDNPDEYVRVETCWIISNIAAGTIDQCHAIIDAGTISKIINIINTEHDDDSSRRPDYNVFKEAVHTITNITCHERKDQIFYLVVKDIVELFCKLLTFRLNTLNFHKFTDEIINCLLYSIENILKTGKTDDVSFLHNIIRRIFQCNGHIGISLLQQHTNSIVANKATQIVETYLSLGLNTKNLLNNTYNVEDQYLLDKKTFYVDKADIEQLDPHHDHHIFDFDVYIQKKKEYLLNNYESSSIILDELSVISDRYGYGMRDSGINRKIE
jgi:hypothetical protein